MTADVPDLFDIWELKDFPEGVGESERSHLAETKTEDWTKTPVPGDIQPTLARIDRIPNPQQGDNVEQRDWISRPEWLLQKESRIPRNLCRQRNEPVFHGIDTGGII